MKKVTAAIIIKNNKVTIIICRLLNLKKKCYLKLQRLRMLYSEYEFGLTDHYCRNVMGSAMVERGVDAIHMSGALGHSDPNTIIKYLTMNYLQGSKIASDMIQSQKNEN
jgi:hypothetical protein